MPERERSESLTLLVLVNGRFAEDPAEFSPQWLSFDFDPSYLLDTAESRNTHLPFISYFLFPRLLLISIFPSMCPISYEHGGI